MTRLTRRRFLTISATATLAPSLGRAATPRARWRGLALGAGCSITLLGLTPDEAAPLFARVEAETARLEAIFSLFRPDSALSRLNRQGSLDGPPAELVEILSLSGTIHDATAGRFDPTVQPVWQAMAKAVAAGATPSKAALARAGKLIGWAGVGVDSDRIGFARPGMALTLNGIAQGYVTDRITALLRDAGLGRILVDMGEIRALGSNPEGGAWRAGIATPDGRLLPQSVALTDRALAVSAPLGTVLDPAGRIGHIIDPTLGRPGGNWQLIAVSAGRAAIADGLSTAFCLMNRDEIATAVARLPGARLEMALG